MIINELLTEDPQPGDPIDLEFGSTLIQTVIESVTGDGVVINLDATALQLIIEAKAARHDRSELVEGWRSVAPIDTVRYTEREGLEGPFRLDSGKVVYYDPVEGKYYDPDTDIYLSYDEYQAHLDEAEYQGRKVKLNKPMQGDVKKSKVYVRGPKGNVVKVNFGDKNMRIKKSNPARRKSFRARHHCDTNPGPKWKARYWSCRAW
jgi:hypothetical protein